MLKAGIMSPAHIISPPTTPPSPSILPVKTTSRMDDFCAEVESSLTSPLELPALQAMASTLRQQFRKSLCDSEQNMLPSFNHTLPTGQERGSFMALDVGGSTLRVALVELSGRDAGAGAMSVVMQRDFRIVESVRMLEGREFFRWMADRIHDAYMDMDLLDMLHGSQPVEIGLTWSFPVEQRSIRDGDLMQMGKGFRATHGLIGHNVADLVEEACHSRNLNVAMRALVNDSSASLLAKAYVDPATQMSLILGTGLNAAIHLPVTSFAPKKFGSRPSSWHEEAHHVIVNTELSMFGKNIFPVSRWDEQLNLTHTHPDFQPLEHFTSGRYLPEVVRLILLDAIRSVNLFDGAIPEDFGAYNMSAEVIAFIEADTSPRLFRSFRLLSECHPLPHGQQYSYSDMRKVKHIIELVSSRAAAYLATSIYSLWLLRLEEEGLRPEEVGDTCLGCTGSVMDKYPSFANRVQGWLDELTGVSDKIRLEMGYETTLFGAAVAVCCQG